MGGVFLCAILMAPTHQPVLHHRLRHGALVPLSALKLAGSDWRATEMSDRPHAGLRGADVRLTGRARGMSHSAQHHARK